MDETMTKVAGGVALTVEVEAEATNATEVSAFEEALAGQNASYAFLSRLFKREVDNDLLAAIAAMRFPAETGNAHLDAGYRGIVRFMNHSGERTRTELAVDFLHSFIGTSQDIKAVAFPYESVYTSREHLLMQDARDGALACYRAAKVVLNDDINEPEDHLGFELEFCQILGERALAALREGDDGACERWLTEKRLFIDEHLLNWVPAFVADVERVGRTPFYKAVARVLLGVLEVDRELLDEVLA